MSTSADRMRRLRERRAAALGTGPDAAALRDADDLLGPAVEEALTALGLGGSDAAAGQLARQYAKVIDSARDPAWAARWMGPLLLECLGSLHATPMSRAKLPRRPGERRAGRLDELRAARRRQQEKV